MKLAAGIDVGSNNVRMIVGRIEGTRIREILADESGITRLAAGISQTGELSNESMEKTFALLEKFVSILKNLGVSQINAAATSAVREAANSAYFLSKARVIGIPLRTITGEEEARYTAIGVLSGVEQVKGCYLIYDIGGGSTELSLVKDGRLMSAVSVPLGVVKLHDIFNFTEAVGQKTLQNCADYSHTAFSETINGLKKQLVGEDKFTAIGTAGSATTAAAMDLAMTVYDPAKVSEHVLSLERIAELLAKSAAVTAAERLKFPGLQKGREDLMIGSFIIIDTILRGFGLKESAVSDLGLREGLLIDTIY